MYDVIIVGRGPAGISAALYALRGGLRTLIVADGTGALEKAPKIDNYYGASGLSGVQIAQAGVEQARALGAEFVDAQVLDVIWSGDFEIETTAGKFAAPSVVIAAGTARQSAPIPGLAALEGAGVSYCAICDGFFYRNKTVGVLGAGAYAAHELSALLPLAARTYVFTNGAQPSVEFPAETNIITDKIARLNGTERLESVAFDDGREFALDGLFVALGKASALSFARKLGLEIKNGAVAVRPDMSTNVPGLFACGDCTGGLLQIAKAAGEGAIAGTAALRYIKERRKKS